MLNHIVHFLLVCALNVHANETDNLFLTIRVNTFRRDDLLKRSLDHYTQCSVVKEIQIIWSDQDNKPTITLDNPSYHNKVKYEFHTRNSLNNRFIPKLDILTEAILSIDDDLLIPCHDVSFALSVWNSNSRVLVGFSPRMYSYNLYTGVLHYLKWQHTWWNGFYSIILTKAAIIHRNYIYQYEHYLTIELLQYIDNYRNCEDLAFAQLIAIQSKSPPVWVKVNAVEIGSTGISSGTSHFSIRSECLEILKKHNGNHVSWISGYQKSYPLGYGYGYDYGLYDWWKLYFYL